MNYANYYILIVTGIISIAIIIYFYLKIRNSNKFEGY